MCEYIKLSDNKVSRTEEIIPDVLLVDYDVEGTAVGIEVLVGTLGPRSALKTIPLDRGQKEK